jgi:hypothetical protein
VAKTQADGAIAGERSGRGKDKVTDACESGKRFGATTGGDSEAGYFREAAGD